MPRVSVTTCTPGDPCKYGHTQGRTKPYSSSKTGLCIECTREAARRKYSGRDSTTGWVRKKSPWTKLQDIDGVASKKCLGSCGLVLALTEFSLDRTGVGGRFTHCKVCKYVDLWHIPLAASARGADKKRGHVSNITKDWVKTQWDIQNGLCSLSGMPMRILYKTKDLLAPSIDRYDSNLFHDIENCSLVCWGWNSAKMASSNEDLKEFMNVFKSVSVNS